jgi:tetratricopeptide (TPR) repeat protein
MAKNKELNDAFNGGKEAAAAKNWQGAADSFEKASQIDPSQNVIWANLADAYVNLAATKPVAEQPAIMEKGLNAYKKAIELKPDDAGYHNNYGLALARDKKFPEAQTELSKAAEIDPPNAGKYYFNLGALLVNSGHNQEAVEAFKKATDANPNYAPAQYQYGVSLVSKATTTADGKVTPPPGTIEAFQKYLELEPNGPYADQAKAMLTTLTGSVETTYQNPNAAKKKKK